MNRPGSISPALPESIVRVPVLGFCHGAISAGERTVPEEVAVALSYNRVGYAVMMATPKDLVDFAIGFSLSEGIIDEASDITGCEVIAVEQGVECRMQFGPLFDERLVRRRRHLAGALGCGLCGLESLTEATRSVPRVDSGLSASAGALAQAMRDMATAQSLNRQTHGMHAAGYFNLKDHALVVREDVGRHNALDKIIGAVAQSGYSGTDRGGGSGAVLLTSRVSIELIQKTALFGSPIIVAVSVPTAHALRVAENAGITVAAVARDDGFEIFTHPSRIRVGVETHVA